MAMSLDQHLDAARDHLVAARDLIDAELGRRKGRMRRRSKIPAGPPAQPAENGPARPVTVAGEGDGPEGRKGNTERPRPTPAAGGAAGPNLPDGASEKVGGGPAAAAPLSCGGSRRASGQRDTKAPGSRSRAPARNEGTRDTCTGKSGVTAGETAPQSAPPPDKERGAPHAKKPEPGTPAGSGGSAGPLQRSIRGDLAPPQDSLQAKPDHGEPAARPIPARPVAAPFDLSAHLDALPFDGSWTLADDIRLVEASIADAFQRACLDLERTPREARARLNLLTGNNPTAKRAALCLLQKRAGAA